MESHISSQKSSLQTDSTFSKQNEMLAQISTNIRSILLSNQGDNSQIFNFTPNDLYQKFEITFFKYIEDLWCFYSSLIKSKKETEIQTSLNDFKVNFMESSKNIASLYKIQLNVISDTIIKLFSDFKKRDFSTSNLTTEQISLSNSFNSFITKLSTSFIKNLWNFFEISKSNSSSINCISPYQNEALNNIILTLIGNQCSAQVNQAHLLYSIIFNEISKKNKPHHYSNFPEEEDFDEEEALTEAFSTQIIQLEKIFNIYLDTAIDLESSIQNDLHELYFTEPTIFSIIEFFEDSTSFISRIVPSIDDRGCFINQMFDKVSCVPLDFMIREWKFYISLESSNPQQNIAQRISKCIINYLSSIPELPLLKVTSTFSISVFLNQIASRDIRNLLLNSIENMISETENMMEIEPNNLALNKKTSENNSNDLEIIQELNYKICESFRSSLSADFIMERLMYNEEKNEEDEDNDFEEIQNNFYNYIQKYADILEQNIGQALEKEEVHSENAESLKGTSIAPSKISKTTKKNKISKTSSSKSLYKKSSSSRSEVINIIPKMDHEQYEKTKNLIHALSGAREIILLLNYNFLLSELHKDNDIQIINRFKQIHENKNKLVSILTLEQKIATTNGDLLIVKKVTEMLQNTMKNCIIQSIGVLIFNLVDSTRYIITNFNKKLTDISDECESEIDILLEDFNARFLELKDMYQIPQKKLYELQNIKWMKNAEIEEIKSHLEIDERRKKITNEKNLKQTENNLSPKLHKKETNQKQKQAKKEQYAQLNVSQGMDLRTLLQNFSNERAKILAKKKNNEKKLALQMKTEILSITKKLNDFAKKFMENEACDQKSLLRGLKKIAKTVIGTDIKVKISINTSQKTQNRLNHGEKNCEEIIRTVFDECVHSIFKQEELESFFD